MAADHDWMNTEIIPYELVSQILYKYGGLEHPVAKILKESMDDIQDTLNAEEPFWTVNSYYNEGEQFEYVAGCEEFTDINTDYGRVLWKLCIEKYNEDIENSNIILNEDGCYAEDNGFLKINYTNRKDVWYEKIGFKKQ